MTLADLSLFWLCCFLGIVACLLWWDEHKMRRRAEADRNWHHAAHVKLTREAADALTRANRAEFACDTLKDQMMRGATVATWHRPAPIPPGADAFYFHVKTTRGDMLITDEALAVALERGKKLLRHA